MDRACSIQEEVENPIQNFSPKTLKGRDYLADLGIDDKKNRIIEYQTYSRKEGRKEGRKAVFCTVKCFQSSGISVNNVSGQCVRLKWQLSELHALLTHCTCRCPNGIPADISNGPSTKWT